MSALPDAVPVLTVTTRAEARLPRGVWRDAASLTAREAGTPHGDVQDREEAEEDERVCSGLWAMDAFAPTPTEAVAELAAAPGHAGSPGSAPGDGRGSLYGLCLADPQAAADELSSRLHLLLPVPWHEHADGGAFSAFKLAAQLSLSPWSGNPMTPERRVRWASEDWWRRFSSVSAAGAVVGLVVGVALALRFTAAGPWAAGKARELWEAARRAVAGVTGADTTGAASGEALAEGDTPETARVVAASLTGSARVVAASLTGSAGVLASLVAARSLGSAQPECDELMLLLDSMDRV
jgi:hypothetical protein